MTCRFENFPDETMFLIFSFLDPMETLCSRRVCRDWRQKLVGCASFSWTFPSTLGLTQTTINGVWLKGYRCRHDGKSEDQDSAEENTHLRTLPFAQRRTKGQLPEPCVLSYRSQLFNENPFQMCSRGNVIAIRMEEYGNSLAWDTVDFSLSSCLMLRMARMQPSPDAPFVLSQKRTKPLLKRILQNADLSGVQHMKRISLRGCPHLQSLKLPSSLEALDVSSCSSLTTLSFPRGQKEKMEAINLRGCRSLVGEESTRLFGPATGDIMKYVKDVDFSATKRLETTVIVDALSKSHNLESISLRYIATDATIRALADSEAAKAVPTLRYVDSSFSENLTDEACESLVNSAISLERFNLRACRSVSSSVYNGVPVWLQNRKSTGKDNSVTFSASLSQTNNNSTSSGQNRRKGDVVFHTTNRKT